MWGGIHYIWYGWFIDYYLTSREQYFTYIQDENKQNIMWNHDIKEGWLVLWCLTILSTILQLYRDGQCYWWRKPDGNAERKSPTCASHWQTVSHCVVHLTTSGIRTHNRKEGGMGQIGQQLLTAIWKLWKFG